MFGFIYIENNGNILTENKNGEGLVDVAVKYVDGDENVNEPSRTIS